MINAVLSTQQYKSCSCRADSSKYQQSPSKVHGP